jgi:hypothetical protein
LAGSTELWQQPGSKNSRSKSDRAERLRHTLALWAEAGGGLFWLELLEPAFLESSWKGALFGEADNWGLRLSWIGHIHCTHLKKNVTPITGKKSICHYEFQIVQGRGEPTYSWIFVQRDIE